MNLARLAERSMGMDESTWARHANRWSFWTRAVTTSPLITLAVWSRVEVGAWAWPILALVLFWIWLNPRVFPAPDRPDGWASRAVFGERIWLERGDELSGHHRTGGLILSTLSAAAALVWIWGMIVLDPWLTAFGLVVSMLTKMWFVDRMASLFDEQVSTSPRYSAWLRGEAIPTAEGSAT